MKVLKFGGSSVANSENIKKVIKIVADAYKKDKNIVVVVSALGGITDQLIDLATFASSGSLKYEKKLSTFCEQHLNVVKELEGDEESLKTLAKVGKILVELGDLLRGLYLLGELSSRSMDKAMSFGELLSSLIISEALNRKGYPCTFVDSREVIKTDDNFGSANVSIEETYALIARMLNKRKGIRMLGGFIASNDQGLTTTLGRGGSDYTAALVGAAVDADVIEIWTDVDGVLTADPRKVNDAFALENITYSEAGELAHFGAKVIHPKTMKPAMLKGIPIDIKNTFNPKGQGTRISPDSTQDRFLIKGITTLGGVSLLRIYSHNGNSIGVTAARVFDQLARYEIEILLTTQASYEQSISIAVSKAHTKQAIKILNRCFALELKDGQMQPISLKENLSIVAIVGKQMRGVPGISGKMFNTLGVNQINIVAISQGSSELNISAVINSDDETKALNALHLEFFN